MFNNSWLQENIANQYDGAFYVVPHFAQFTMNPKSPHQYIIMSL